MSIKVYGASDDLIEVEGDIREEFNPPYDEATYLAFSDGTIITVDYSKQGVWRIAPVIRGGAQLDVAQAPADDEDNYSDIATLDGDIKWVVMGTQYAKV